MLWIFGLPVTGLLFIVVLLTLPLSRNGSAIHSIGSFWCRIILSLCGIKVEIEGLERIPQGRSFILASNHQGIFDIPVLQGLLPVQYRWVAKQSLFKIPVIGWTMGFAGYVSINRENPKAAFKSIIKAAEKIKAGTSVLIFPEGTRCKEDHLLPFKRGVFMLATRSEVPVVPVSISGTRDIMLSHSIWIRPQRVTVHIGEPVETAGRKEPEVMEIVREAILKGLPWKEEQA